MTYVKDTVVVAGNQITINVTATAGSGSINGIQIFDRIGDCGLVTTYCTGGTTTLGCTPQIAATGTPSASLTTP